MGGMIIWIIIVVIIISVSSNKNKAAAQKMQGEEQRAAQSSASRDAARQFNGGSRQHGKKPGGDILQRAKANVAEEFSDNETSDWDREQAYRERAGINTTGSGKPKKSKDTKAAAASTRKKAAAAYAANSGDRKTSGTAKASPEQPKVYGDGIEPLGTVSETASAQGGFRPVGYDALGDVMWDVEKNVLCTVEDLIIIGPNTEPTFHRDFIAEGVDFLNRIQGL